LKALTVSLVNADRTETEMTIQRTWLRELMTAMQRAGLLPKEFAEG